MQTISSILLAGFFLLVNAPSHLFIHNTNEVCIGKAEKTLPISDTPVFYAVMNERRAADQIPGTAVFIDRFNQVNKNTGNAFNASLGSFIAPAEGVYHLSGSVEFENFSGYKVSCSTHPGVLEFTVVKNETDKVEEFLFSSRHTSNISSTTRNFNVLVKLRANDAIRLKVKGKACDNTLRPWIRKVIFAGMRVY